MGSAKRGLPDQVRKACQSGEGLRVEFKPFIDPSDKLSRNEDISKRAKEKTKLREVLETVAAFANTEGGRIYLGVNDDCSVSGIDQALRAWAEAARDESSINRYLGALKSKIKELVQGEVALQLSHTEVDDMLVVVIEVPPAAQGPVALQQEYHLYVRTGASNRKAPPEQWKSILKPDKPHRLL